MADSDATLAGLLDRASNVFDLAHKLGRELQEDFQSRGDVYMAGGESPRVRHRVRANEFISAAKELGDAIKRPPHGFEGVAERLREAAKIARQLSKLGDWAFLGMWPDLNTVAVNGYEAVKAARTAARLDDPFGFLDEIATPGQEATGNNTNSQQTHDDNVSARIPRTDDEADLLKVAIKELLQKIPETWEENDHNKLTNAQETALFLLVAAGMVEQRLRYQLSMANHPLVVEATVTATGECGFDQATQPMVARLWERWADAWRKWNAGESRDVPAFHIELIKPDWWRLTDQGVIALNELRQGDRCKVCDFVLKRGVYDGKPRLIDGQVKQRKPVPGYGILESMTERRADVEPTSVNVANWDAGATALAEAMGAQFAAIQANSNSDNDHPTEPTGESPAESPIGFLGGAALADALGVHATRRDAFSKQLERVRKDLGDGCWHEVLEPRPNIPRFLYLVDSPKLREMAASYKTPKSA